MQRPYLGLEVQRQVDRSPLLLRFRAVHFLGESKEHILLFEVVDLVKVDTVRDGSSVKNIIFWLRLAACCDVNAERKLLMAMIYLIRFRVAFLAEHKCLAVNSGFTAAFLAEHKSLAVNSGFTVAFLAEHKCLAVNS